MRPEPASAAGTARRRRVLARNPARALAGIPARVLFGVLVAVLAGFLALVPGGVREARAQDHDQDGDVPARSDDYDALSEQWNGLNTLTALAKGLGLTVEPVAEIDWDDLGVEDILFVLYPRDRVEPGHLAAFVRNGGHVLLADDFGDSTEAMGRLGMLRVPAIGVAAERFYRDLPYAPIAQPLMPDHPLAAGVTELSTNHPAVLRQVQGPEVVFGFGAGEGVIAAGSMGSGRFVVSSDPSIFINRMLHFDGNMRFAINVIRYLSRDGAARRLVILAGDFNLYGEPSGVLDDGTVRGTMASMLSDFNRWLDERNDYLLTNLGTRAAAVLVAALIALLCLLSLPLARKSRLEGDWTRAAATTSVAPDDFEQIVHRYDHARQGNFLLPATVIRDTINSCLSRVLGHAEPLYSLREQQLVDSLVERHGQAAASAYRRLHKRLRSLPSRGQAASPWSTGFISRRDFERLHEDAQELYLALGEEPG
jgi:hypothetical protein